MVEHQPQVSDSVGLEWTICISNKFPGIADATVLRWLLKVEHRFCKYGSHTSWKKHMILGNRWTEVPLDHVVKNVGFFGFLFYLLLLTLKKRIHRQLIVESFLIFGNLSKRDYKILTKKKKQIRVSQSFVWSTAVFWGPPKKQILKWGLKRCIWLIWQLQVHWQGSNDTGERMKGSLLSYWSLIPLGSSGKQYKTYVSELSWTSREGTGVLILPQPLGIAYEPSTGGHGFRGTFSHCAGKKG